MTFISTIVLIVAILNAPNTDKSKFYNAFESSSLSTINEQLNNLSSENESTQSDAYIGALTMKKSQFEESPKGKILVFKEGMKLLESSISKEPENGEYRFLRFVIQEHTPKILKYNSNINEDLIIVIEKYSSMDSSVKKAIKNYAVNSSNLSSSKLK
ncbi:MAG: hypothetical protein ACI9J3_001490 [Parvicellaceae bacterium]|jgi:hypothetical protein